MFAQLRAKKKCKSTDTKNTSTCERRAFISPKQQLQYHKPQYKRDIKPTKTKCLINKKHAKQMKTIHNRNPPSRDIPLSSLQPQRFPHSLSHTRVILTISQRAGSLWAAAGCEQPGATLSLWMAFHIFKQVQTAKRRWIKQQSRHSKHLGWFFTTHMRHFPALRSWPDDLFEVTKWNSLHLLDGFFFSSSFSWIRWPHGLHAWFVPLPLGRQTTQQKGKGYSQ